MQQIAIEAERWTWKEKVDELQQQLDQEKHDKEAQKQWQEKFVFEGSNAERSVSVDATDDAFARFAQSLALLPASEAPKVTKAGALPFLAHLLRENLSDLVMGSVLLALTHLAIHEGPKTLPRHRSPTASEGANAATAAISLNVKEEIVKAGVSAPLVHVLEHNRNPRVLSEASRLCAALSSHLPNKRVLASKNVVRHLLGLLIPSTLHSVQGAVLETARSEYAPLEGDHDVQQNALSALVNLSHGTIKASGFVFELLKLMLHYDSVDSEILRSQIVNYQFLPVAVRYLRESNSLAIKAEAAKLIGNLACNHVVNQSAIMTVEGDAALSKGLTAKNMQLDASLVRASAIGIANLAYTPVNQLSIGYGDAMTFLLQLLVDTTLASIVEACAIAITCLCHQNPLNKSRVAAQNGLQVLLYVISQSHRYGHDEGALIAACECMSVIARPKMNRQQALDLDGHLPLLQLCRQANSLSVVESSAASLCALLPSAHDREALLADGKESKMETRGAVLFALERAHHLLAESGTIPLWLTTGIETLRSFTTSPNTSLPSARDEDENEFYARTWFALESITEIAPDALCAQFYN